jgi:hypothetical protein
VLDSIEWDRAVAAIDRVLLHANDSGYGIIADEFLAAFNS